MLYPHTELRFASVNTGFGVFALQPIPKGTVTWVRDPLDHQLSIEEAQRLAPELLDGLSHDYYRIFGGPYLLTHDITHFMNHSCNPTCAHLFRDVEIAIRDIAVGEELTSDYASFTLGPHEEFRCYCAAPACRQWVRRDDPSSHRDYWMPALEEALRHFASVQQPLKFLFGQSSLSQTHDLRSRVFEAQEM
jgi:SET domain-containing protein